jgi:hypothetical protein
VRLFPPIPTRDGRTQKFGQPQGTGVRAYIPPPVAEILSDAERPLAITEGEVKALALTQAGYPCIGLGGVWNFRCKDLPRDRMIEDLEQITWAGRAVHIIPDSDAWTNDQVLQATFTVARLLQDRDAAVMIVKLQALPGHEKMGADDYLVAKGPTAFRRLIDKAVTLGHPAFRPFRLKEKIKRKMAAATVPPILAGRRIHPAIHFENDLATLGIVEVTADGLVCFVVTNSREKIPAGALPESVLLTRPEAYRGLDNRWPAENLARFLAEDEAPSWGEVVAIIAGQVLKHVELRRPAEAMLVAVFVLATYFHPLFPAFPRLVFTGERGSGKTKVLSIMAAISFNGLLRLDPTPAVLFRLIESIAPTLVLDEIDGLDREDRREILAIIDSGYKRGAYVDRCEGEDHRVRSFAVYCPMALAGIKGVNATTEDRSIAVVMTRGADPARLNQEVDLEDSIWGMIRGSCYRLALTRWREVREIQKLVTLPAWLQARERELWGPLLAVGALADREENLGASEDLLQLARGQTADRGGLSVEAAAVIEALLAKLGEAEEVMIEPGTLCEEVEQCLRWDRVTPERIGSVLRRLGFHRHRLGGRSRYVVSKNMLRELQARYMPPEDCMTASAWGQVSEK